MENTYKSILKSSGLIAYVQIFQMALGLVRNKVVALVLGASGFGIWGLFNTFMEMVTTFSTLGIDQSGVKDIAQKSEDSLTVAKCIYVFRIMILVMSSILCICVIICSEKISLFLFNTDKYRWGVVALSFVLIFRGISRGNISILNGLRHLKELAISQIYGTILGSCITVALVLIWGEPSIPWALLFIGITLAFSTTFYVRKIHILKVKLTWFEFKTIAKPLFLLGLSFSFSGFISTVMTLLSRSYLSNHFELKAVGIYQASWTISNLYIGIILTAMGVDFMPRLMKVIGNKEEVNKMINQQLETGILLSSIGVVSILLFSDLFLYLLYSKEFESGSEIIRWQVLGVMMRIFAFPFSYSIAAKGKALLYAISQFVFWTLDYLLLIFFASYFGFEGLGVNYVVAYSVFLSIVFLSCKRLFDFNLSSMVVRLIVKTCVFILIAWFSIYFVSGIKLYVIAFIEIVGLLWFVNTYMRKRMDIDLCSILIKKLRKND